MYMAFYVAPLNVCHSGACCALIALVSVAVCAPFASAHAAHNDAPDSATGISPRATHLRMFAPVVLSTTLAIGAGKGNHAPPA